MEVTGLAGDLNADNLTADSASFSMTIENLPSETNPRTGRITALSLMACLRSLTRNLRVGT